MLSLESKTIQLESLDDLRWRGARRDELEAVCRQVAETEVVPRMPVWRPASRTEAR